MTLLDDLCRTRLGGEAKVLVPVLLMRQQLKNRKFFRAPERLADLSQQGARVIWVDSARNDAASNLRAALVHGQRAILHLSREQNAFEQLSVSAGVRITHCEG